MSFDSCRNGATAFFQRRAHTDDVGPRRSERLGHREADAALRAGDDRELAGEVEGAAHRAATSTRIFMARPASRSSKAARVSASGTTRVIISSVGMTSLAISSMAVSKSVRW